MHVDSAIPGPTAETTDWKVPKTFRKRGWFLYPKAQPEVTIFVLSLTHLEKKAGILIWLLNICDSHQGTPLDCLAWIASGDHIHGFSRVVAKKKFLFQYHWHTVLHKFQVYNIVINSFLHYSVVITISVILITYFLDLPSGKHHFVLYIWMVFIFFCLVS